MKGEAGLAGWTDIINSDVTDGEPCGPRRQCRVVEDNLNTYCPWQALLMSPKGWNESRDGFVNLKISLNTIAPFKALRL